jgi:hypothetical protein
MVDSRRPKDWVAMVGGVECVGIKGFDRNVEYPTVLSGRRQVGLVIMPLAKLKKPSGVVTPNNPNQRS